MLRFGGKWLVGWPPRDAQRRHFARQLLGHPPRSMLVGRLQALRRMKTVAVTSLIAIVLGSCALDASTGGSGPGGSAGGKADDLSEGAATITFAADFSEELAGAIVPGAPLRVVYDADLIVNSRAGRVSGGELLTEGGRRVSTAAEE